MWTEVSTLLEEYAVGGSLNITRRVCYVGGSLNIYLLEEYAMWTKVSTLIKAYAMWN